MTTTSATEPRGVPELRAEEGLVPEPLRQATEITVETLFDVIGLPAGGDPDVQRRLAEVAWAFYCAPAQDSLARISRRQGVTAERIRQLRGHALRLLRHPSRAHAVKTWVRTDTRLWHAIRYGCFA